MAVLKIRSLPHPESRLPAWNLTRCRWSSFG